MVAKKNLYASVRRIYMQILYIVCTIVSYARATVVGSSLPLPGKQGEGDAKRVKFMPGGIT